MSDSDPQTTYRFAEFDFRAGTGELYRDDRRVNLRPQAAVVLERLLRQPGELVTRAELRRTLWGDTAVDAEAGLNHCIRQVRRALGDSAAEPRFVATEPRRGYRFIGAVRTDARDRFALRRVAASIIVALLLLTGAALMVQPDRRGAAAPAQVFADYERARYLLQQPDASAAGRAIPLLERVAQDAPEFAAGHAALARALLQADPTSTGESARRHAARALDLAPDLADALLVRGEIRSLIDRDWAAAELDFRRAREAAPDLAAALHHQAGLRALLGDDEGAIRMMQQALELDPVSPLLAGDLAWFHFVARDWHAAGEWARRTLELEPAWGAARSVLLHASARVGDVEELRRQATATMREADATPAEIAQVAGADDPYERYWRWWDGRLATAEGPSSHIHRSWTHAALGRVQPALDDLEAAAASGYRPLLFLVRDPRFDPLRGEPRFRSLLRRLDLGAVLVKGGDD